jgi:glucose uptake protein
MRCTPIPRIVCRPFTGGVIFNVVNLLLVAAIDIAGLAVAFPIGIGLALVTAIALAPLF